MAFLSSLTNLAKRFTAPASTGGGQSWGGTPSASQSQFSISRPQNVNQTGFQINSANPNTAGISLNKASGALSGAQARPSTITPSIQQIRAPQITSSFGTNQPANNYSVANPNQVNALSQAVSAIKPAVTHSNQGTGALSGGFVSSDPVIRAQIDAMNQQAVNQSSFAQPSQQQQQQPSSIGGQMPLPTTPTSMPATGGLSALQQAYLDSLNQSPEEIAAQQRINDIIAQQANLNASEQLGLNKISDQAIASPFITGQSASLQRSVAGQMGALEAQATPLVNQLALAQAGRQSAGERAKAALEFEQAQQASLAPQIKEVGGALVQFDPTTGQYTEVYRSPSEQAKPIALGEGQILVDPVTGQQIAMGNPKTTTPDFGKTQVINGELWQQNPTTGTWGKVDAGNVPTEAKIQKAQEVAGLAQEVLNDANFNSLFGPISSRLPTLSGATATLQAKVDRLKSLLTIDNMGIMKGVLSDSDMKVLASAATALNTGMGQDGARAEIQNILTKMRNTMNNAGQNTVQSDPLGLGFKVASGQALNSPVSSLKVPPENKTVKTAMGSAIITGYGSKFWKPGLDIVFPGGKNAKVTPPKDFTVLAVNTGYNKGFGNQVKIRDADGQEVWLSHLSSVNSLKPGQTYRAGTPVGLQGNTGKTYGATGIHVDITMPRSSGGYYDAKQVAAYINAQT